MEIIKFDIDKLEKDNTGFNYYILGRSYDLEENGLEEDLDKALYYYLLTASDAIESDEN